MAITLAPLSHKPNGPHDAFIRATSAISVRRASLADLNAMLDIGLAAMPLDPQWNWRFPNRHCFPEDHRKFTRSVYRDFLENKSGNWLVMLAEITGQDSLTSAVPVAFAVWNLTNLANTNQNSHAASINGAYATLSMKRPSLNNLQGTNTQPCIYQPATATRRDANEQRLTAWKEWTSKARSVLFDAPLGRQYFQLQILATHPDFQRQGAGSALCDWGLRISQLTGLVVSVFASPMGRLLYGRLGFTTVGSVRIGAQGETEHVILTAMVYLPCTA
jgi:hypothetical protein